MGQVDAMPIKATTGEQNGSSSKTINKTTTTDDVDVDDEYKEYIYLLLLLLLSCGQKNAERLNDRFFNDDLPDSLIELN